MVYGILSAVLFGISAPLSKLLLEGIDPIILAGLLYLGAGGAMALLLALRKLRKAESEARIERRDLPWLAGATLAGGILGPILLLLGLQLAHAATASLLLNLEVVATGLIAFLLFRESVGRRAWIAIIAVAVGGAFLSIDLSSGLAISPGALLIVGACFAWGFDNNFTGKISLKDPRRIVLVKGIAAGSFSFLLGVVLGRPLPSLIRVFYALALGAVSYGASISLFVLSLRRVGAARTGVLFGLASFVGVVLSLAIFRQLPAWPFFAALLLMALATVLLAREKHQHLHTHTAMTHTHPHRHDDGHHEHRHAGEPNKAEAHVHEHEHDDMTHSHEHRPDPHHRHSHRDDAHSSPDNDQRTRSTFMAPRLQTAVQHMRRKLWHSCTLARAPFVSSFR